MLVTSMSNDKNSFTEPAAMATAPDAIAQSGAGSRPQRVLQQEHLQKALAQKSETLAVMYSGALRVLADDKNRDRHALSAHGLRELMEKLPKFLDVPTPAHKESMTEKLRSPQDKHGSATSSSTCRGSNGTWNGTIDEPLRGFLVAIDSFFEWLAKHHPRRRAEAQQTLLKLDPSGRPLPAALRDLNVEAWRDMHNYFQGVSHHTKAGDADEFDSYLDALERFLLERLVPRTFEDFGAIDALLTK